MFSAYAKIFNGTSFFGGSDGNKRSTWAATRAFGRATLRECHLERLNKGKCNPSTAITYVELIHTMERMTDNCINIADSVMDDINHRLVGHYTTDPQGGVAVK